MNGGPFLSCKFTVGFLLIIIIVQQFLITVFSISLFFWLFFFSRPEDLHRIRVEHMERQLANLTGLVQKALHQTPPNVNQNYLGVPGQYRGKIRINYPMVGVAWNRDKNK